MNKRASSLSIDDITARAEKAAQQVLGSRMKEFGGDGIEIGYFPDFGTVGLVLRNPKLENFTATELLDLSHKMVDVMDIGGDIRANVNIGKGGITMGYFPHDIVMSKQLR